MKSHSLSLLTTLLVIGLADADVAAAEREIKVFRVGSSSFSYVLMQDVQAIVEASGEYRLVSDRKADQAGYTRLDQFLTQPGLFEEWCEEQIPRIEQGDYDFVIIQTIGWLNFTPEQQERLCTEIIPELAQRIQATGAEVILYDKYLPIKYDQKDPRARTWCCRYPEGYRLNYLLHILAAKHAGIDKISFGGEAVTQLWQQEQFVRVGNLYCDPSHPGPMANYISAVNLAYLLTGQDPAGNPVRELPFDDMRAVNFAKLANSDRPGDREMYEANKDRIRDGVLVLREEEARTLQEAAMNSQRQWAKVLHASLQSEDTFAQTVQEIRRIQAEMDQFEKYGLDAGTIEALRLSYARPEAPGELPPAEMEKIRRKSKSIDYADVAVRNYCRRYLSREQYQAAQAAYAGFWQENNSKLRDDVYFECRVLEQQAIRDGDRDEAKRLKTTAGMINYVLSLPAYRIVLERVNQEQQQTILSDYVVNGPTYRNSPAFGAYQNEQRGDLDGLCKAWDVYLEIWTDPELMDELKESRFSIAVFEEADRRFQEFIHE